MATLIDLTKPVKLLILHNKKKLGMYRHNGDRYPGLHLTIGVRKSAWSFRGRINGKVRSLNVGTFPEMNANQAFKQIAKETAHRGNTTTAEIRTVRDAWNEYREDARANARASEKHLADLTRKLDRYAGNLLNMSPTQVSLLDVRRCLNSIPSVSTRHHVKAGINNSYSMLDIPNPIQRGKVKLQKVGSRETFWKQLCDADNTLDRRDWSPFWDAIRKKRDQNVLIGTAWVVMLFTGIRSNDVRSLTWDQVDLQRGEITLHKMKNGETRTIPVCRTVVDALSAIYSNHEHIFPADSRTGYIDHFDVLKANVNGGHVNVLRAHDTRHHFTSACAPARVPSYGVAFLRGDITSKNADDEMAMHYQEDLDMHELVHDIEKVITERIKITPSFVD